MKYAVIENGVVTNIAESAYQLETNWEEIPPQMPVRIGDHFDNGVYRSPEGEMRMSAELSAALSAYEQAFRMGVQQA